MASYDHLPEEVTITRGEMAVILRRMDALRQSLANGDVILVQFGWEQTYSALQKAFKIKREVP